MQENLHDQPLISVITVCYNSSSIIRRTIESVLSQVYTNVEYILVDGLSKDDTLEIIQEYQDPFNKKGISYRWISEKDSGIYDAMNKGVTLSNGRYINFMNSGDLFYDSEVLEKLVPLLGADLVYGNHAIYQNKTSNNKVYDVSDYTGNRNIPYCHQALFIGRSYFEKFPFDTNMRIAADYNQYLQCKRAGASIDHIPLVICLYLDGGVSTVSRRKLIKEYFDVMKGNNMVSAYFVYYTRLIKYFLFNK